MRKRSKVFTLVTWSVYSKFSVYTTTTTTAQYCSSALSMQDFIAKWHTHWPLHSVQQQAIAYSFNSSWHASPEIWLWGWLWKHLYQISYLFTVSALAQGSEWRMYSQDFQDRAQIHSQDFQKRGSWDQVQGVGVIGGKLREYTRFWQRKNGPDDDFTA